MSIPFEPTFFGSQLNIHLILEYLAFFVAFRYYIWLRKQSKDHISKSNRLSIILGAIVGSLIGSRLMGYLEAPTASISFELIITLLNTKTIMGGLFGGLIGVELSKKIIGETSSSGDLFTFPIIVGIFIGRIGCFLTGINEFTYGTKTNFILGMNLGDGFKRHPIALYELLFLILLFFLLHSINKKKTLTKGRLFQYFMIAYFGFRFVIEFIKPNNFYILELSSIQWLCLICWLYYYKTFIDLIKNAY